jgi:AcrR family transcriptional regulator
MKDKDATMANICERFGIPKPTLYQYVGSDGDE